MKHLIYVNSKILLILSIITFGILSPKLSIYDVSLPQIIPKELTTNAINQVKKIDMKHVICMANNIFFEAGGEPVKGQAAVARVVLNRVSHGFAPDPCKVINQTVKVDDKKVCQFNWVCENKKLPSTNDPRYVNAMNVAYDVMANDAYKDVVTKNTLYFHNTTVEPHWPHKKVTQIGNHIFYAKSYKNEHKSGQR